MLFSTQMTATGTFILGDPFPLTRKTLFSQTATIHSSKGRRGVFHDGTNFGKLRNGFIRPPSVGGVKPSNNEGIFNASTAQNWRKNLTVNIDEESVEKGLRDYLGISQPFRTKNAADDENTNAIPSRTVTSSSKHRMRLVSSMKSIVKPQSSREEMLRRDLMCSTEEVDTKDFTDEDIGEKFQRVKFLKAPPKEYAKLLKLNDYDITLVPSDSRRIVIEAIMRDYFLNLIPENTDFLICKNTQTAIYSILFTGKLVPTCKACSSITKFELSPGLGFQVLCMSQYCKVKILYRTKLSKKTIDCLWNKTERADIEHSLPIKDSMRKPIISRLIQSGKYKKTDFSRVISDICASTTQEVNTRPNTTANVMRENQSKLRFSKIMMKSIEGDVDQRPNTVQGLRRPLSLRPGTSGSNKGGEFKGVSVLKEFEDRGLFMRDKEENEVIEQVSEEISGNELEREKEKRRKVLGEVKNSGAGKKGQVVRKITSQSQKDMKIRINGKFGMYMGQKKNKGNSFGEQEPSNKLDNSLEDIHDMMNLLNKGN